LIHIMLAFNGLLYIFTIMQNKEETVRKKIEARDCCYNMC